MEPENGGSKDEMREKIGMGRDATDGLDKMRDARCEYADGMEVEDEMEKWGYRWKRQDGLPELLLLRKLSVHPVEHITQSPSARNFCCRHHPCAWF